ncbi:MoaD/ThiS family protein [Nocardia veterana]|uniref:MoaD/ThiS family protein n=1 Tax=Nocardia veterana TaxID=132249 RepID=A0A7X6RKX3_9NOCA|nr:MoaD/ThiS family protein [Nocardia veterana]NKY89736.1 MoaD/ThiS family protein [Nocardia veterana]
MSEVRFILPGNWQTLTGRDMSDIRCTDVETLGEALRWLATEYPAVAARVLTSEGTIPRYATVALDNERVTTADGLDTPLTRPQHEVCVLSAFMGG